MLQDKELETLIKKFPEYEAALDRLNSKMSLIYLLLGKVNARFDELDGKLKNLNLDKVENPFKGMFVNVD